MRLLLLEDEKELADLMARRLSAENYVVDCFSKLEDAKAAVTLCHYDALVVDRRLPDGDGIDLLKNLVSSRPRPPALVLSAMADLEDRVAGLDGGADDYLAKPFAPEELSARLRAILRRSPVIAKRTVEIGRLVFDLNDRSAVVDGVVLQMPRREGIILENLVRRAGRVVLRETLESAIYGFDDEIASNSLEAQISRLRRRFRDRQAGVTIHVMRGVGYLLTAERADSPT